MPELPEVETVARGLQSALPGSRIESVRRYGKFMLIELQPRDASRSKFSLQVHLGMTGRMVVSSSEEPAPPHTHVFMKLDDSREVRYTDPRRFGLMRIVAGGARDALLATVGLEPLTASESEFRSKVGTRR